MIHVFGDSHAALFADDRFLLHYVGPATAYNLPNETSTTQAKPMIVASLQKIVGKEKHPRVIFVFGEIDCRIHIYNQHKKKKLPLKNVASTTVTRYAEFLKEMTKQFPQVQFAVLNVLPQGEEENSYNYHHYASRQVRMEITRMVNTSLKEVCQKLKIVYLEVFDELMDENENRIPTYIADHVHYNTRVLVYIIPLLRKNGWL